ASRARLPCASCANSALPLRGTSRMRSSRNGDRLTHRSSGRAKSGAPLNSSIVRRSRNRFALHMLLEKRKGPLGRSVYSVSASSPEALDAALTVPAGRHFVLFLAWDSSDTPDETILKLARSLIPRGLVYIVAWGPDCERVHDLFDDVDVESNLDSTDTADTVIMSTWHTNDSLAEALRFSLHSAYPAEAYEST